MAYTEPAIFLQLMQDMDEDRLMQFIQEQELQARMEQQANNLKEVVMNADFDPKFDLPDGEEEEVKEVVKRPAPPKRKIVQP